MRLNSVKVWAFGIGFLCALIFFATLGLGAKPKFDSASDMNEEREQVEFQNDKLRAEVTKLRGMEDRLPETRQAIADLQVGIPVTTEVEALIQHVGDLADANDVVIAKMELAKPEPYAPDEAKLEAEAEPTAEPSAEASAEPGTGEEPEAVAPGEAPAADAATTTKSAADRVKEMLDGFSLMEMTLEVQGSYADAKAFVDDLQVKSTRHFLLWQFTFEGFDEDKAGTKGLPDAEAGDVTVILKGTAYVLPGIAQPEDPDAEEAADPKMPKKPGANDNPFTPIEGLPAP